MKNLEQRIQELEKKVIALEHGQSISNSTLTRYLTVEEVAELLKISARTVYNKTSSGELSVSHKFNGRSLYDKKEIDGHIDTLLGFDPDFELGIG